MMKLVDPYGRTIDYLRISITDRCNLDCLYCAPLGGRKRRSHAEILSYEEILRITNAAVHSGISKIRITGGEPLQRKGMVRLCRMLADIDGIESLAMTSNGILLKEFAAPLFEAGVRRVNISLDTLKPERFRNITGKDLLSQVFEGIEAAEKVGMNPIKINTVVMRGINDDEIEDLAGLTLEKPYHVRFIELMPTQGYTKEKHRALFVPISEMIHRINMIENLQLIDKDPSFGPATLYSFPGAPGKVGFIAPLSRHFCETCNRLRLTADGKLRACLFSEKEIDIKGFLRKGASMQALSDLIKHAARSKPQQHHLNDIAPKIPSNRTMRAIGG
ncbi:MAG: GTP 3',8-cyclase MoaA [Desulfobacterales bacterium]|jgi:cyclic pyranopterin phosphate synthase|nr:GTP 3',8-cyclase MoaA [Desulfobacterales bacterium]